MLRILRRVEDELGDLKVCWVFEVDGFCEEWLPERGNYSFSRAAAWRPSTCPTSTGTPASSRPWSRRASPSCGCTLLAKTNDITFATIDGGPLRYAYWNGARHARFECVPCALREGASRRRATCAATPHTGLAHLLERPSEMRGAEAEWTLSGQSNVSLLSNWAENTHNHNQNKPIPTHNNQSKLLK